MRMSRRLRDPLSQAARAEHRSVASLLEKIISDYLIKQGFIEGPEAISERRKFRRSPVHLPAVICSEPGDPEAVVPCMVLDLSAGGAQVACARSDQLAFSAAVLPRTFILKLSPPWVDGELTLTSESKHLRHTGDEPCMGAAFMGAGERGMAVLREHLA